MPPVRRVVCDPDSLTIETSLANVGTITLTRAMIPAAILNQPMQNIETWINTRLSTFLSAGGSQGMYAQIHIFTVVPQLLFTAITSDVPIPPNWWVV